MKKKTQQLMTGLCGTEIRNRKQGRVFLTQVFITGENMLSDTMTLVPNPGVVQIKFCFSSISFLK